MRATLLFRLLTLLTLVAAAGWLSFGLWARFGGVREALAGLAAGPYTDDDGSAAERSLGAGFVARLAYLVAVICVVLLALTGFVPYVAFGEPLFGAALLVHVFAAPVFSVAATALCLLWAHDRQLEATDRKRLLSRTIEAGRAEEVPPGAARTTLSKLCFWLLAALTPMILGSILLSMYPAFGSAGQESLRTLHFSSALAFVLVATIHARLSVPVPE